MRKKTLFTLLHIFVCLGIIQNCYAQTDSLSVDAMFARKTMMRAPVVPFKDTLFYICSNIGSFSVEERAKSVTEKIKKLGKERNFQRDSLRVVCIDNLVEIAHKEEILMGITAADAFAGNKTQIVLAQEYEDIIGSAIIKYKQQNDWRYILIRVSATLLIFVALFFLIKLINLLFKKISNWIEKQKENKIKAISIKSFNLLDAKKTVKLILTGITLVRYIVILFMLYLSAPVIFSIFPPTRGIADKMFGYVLAPVQKILHNMISYIPNLITLIIIVLVFRYLIKGLRYFANEIAKGKLNIKGFYADWAMPSFNIIRTLLYIFMFIVIFPYLPGSGSDVFKGVSIFVGIVFSLGSSSIINNVVSGFVLTYMRPFKLGDRIKIGDVIGNVIEKTAFVTRLRTPKNEVITIPNSNIMAAQTFNYTQSAEVHKLILYSEVSVSYDIPWRKVHQLLLEAGARTANVLKDPKPFILQTALDDFNAVYQINIYTQEADKMAFIYSELNQHLQDVFNEAGIELLAPHEFKVKVKEE